MARAEPFPLELVPAGCLLLLPGVDTHDNRLECNVWGYGRGCETWTIADRVFYGNPDENALWDELSEFLFETEFDHASGAKLKIHATAIDSGPLHANRLSLGRRTSAPQRVRHPRHARTRKSNPGRLEKNRTRP